MIHEIQGIRFESPQEFAAEDVMLTLRSPAQQKPSGAAHPVRANIILNRRRVHDGGNVHSHAAEIAAQLLITMPNLKDLTSDPFSFADGAPGVIIGFTFETKRTSVRQMQAVRLDGTKLTTLTLTTDVHRFGDDSKEIYLRTLQSVVLTD